MGGAQRFLRLDDGTATEHVDFSRFCAALARDAAFARLRAAVEPHVRARRDEASVAAAVAARRRVAAASALHAAGAHSDTQPRARPQTRPRRRSRRGGGRGRSAAPGPGRTAGTRAAAAAALAAPPKDAAEPVTEREIFDFLDKDGNGRVTATELLVMARHRTLDSPLLYAMDSISLGAFAVCAAQAGISRGLPPVVSCAAGFTVCFGGILRDLLSGRTDGIAIGAESFALATGAGAIVYVGLRELVVRGVLIPLGLRIFLGGGTTVGLRIAAWYSENDLLAPMANYL